MFVCLLKLTFIIRVICVARLLFHIGNQAISPAYFALIDHCHSRSFSINFHYAHIYSIPIIRMFNVDAPPGGKGNPEIELLLNHAAATLQQNSG